MYEILAKRKNYNTGKATITPDTTLTAATETTEIQFLREQVEILKSQLCEKERIIRLLEYKNK